MTTDLSNGASLGSISRLVSALREPQQSENLGSPSNGATKGRPRASSLPSRRALVAAISTKRGPSNSTKRGPSNDPSLGALIDACDQAELVSLAISEGVAGLASERLGVFLSSTHRSKLLFAVRQEIVRHLANVAWLQRFGMALDQAEVTWVVLKGPVLTEISYEGTSRRYADLDLMVHARELPTAVKALEGAGAVVANQDWPSLIKNAKGELTMAVHGSPLIDLHWHLIYHRSARQRFMLPTAELLERRERVRLHGVDAWSLDPVDFAAHVALHASFQGAQRLRRLLDIERTVANQPPDWDVFVQRCRSWRVGFPVSALLNCRARRLAQQCPKKLYEISRAHRSSASLYNNSIAGCPRAGCPKVAL